MNAFEQDALSGLTVRACPTARPLSTLLRDPLNVRKKDADDSIGDLAALIASQGLLQNLVVRAEHKGEGPDRRPTGKFGVVAGGRRLAALELLAHASLIPKDFPVPVLEVTDDEAIAVSLAENSGREALHGADLFEAFRAMREQGRSVEQIADAWNVEPRTVEKRLKLAALSPALLEMYRNDGATLDQMIALTLTDDHATQEAIWRSESGGPSAYAIRRRLTANSLAGSHPWAQFIGEEAYTQAGGGLRRDLFADAHGAWWEDAALLERLTRDRLRAHADALAAAESLAWVDVHPSFTFDVQREYTPCRRVSRTLTAEEQAQLDALGSEVARLQEQLDGLNDDDASDEEAEAMEDALEASVERLRVLKESLREIDPRDQALSGAVVYVDHGGALIVQRGVFRRRDQEHARRCADDPTDVGCDPASAKDAPAKAEFSERLLRHLTAHRSAAIRLKLAEDPETALRILAYQLSTHLFCVPPGHDGVDHPLELSLTSANLESNGDDLAVCPATVAFDALRFALGEQMPETRPELLAHLLACEMTVVSSVLALCTAYAFNGVHGRAGHRPIADAVAQALDLDMASYWVPTRRSYFDAVTKAKTLEAIAEAVSKETAAKLAGLKKDQLAIAAEEALAGRRWLPTPLRASRGGD